MPSTVEFRTIGDVYSALISCVETAIDRRKEDMAVVCASALMGLAKAERGSYYENGYKTALNKIRDAYKLVENRGCPIGLEDGMENIKKDYEKLTGKKLK